jgi:hypothetical protein
MDFGEAIDGISLRKTHGGFILWIRRQLDLLGGVEE